MAKSKVSFFCNSCGAQHAQWMGQCSSCREWNTISEEVLAKKSNSLPSLGRTAKSIQRIQEVQTGRETRFSSKNDEFDRVLGGGIVLGSVILLGGEPGVGKSTLLLQIALQLTGIKTLYVSGEESASQIKLRAERIGIKTENCFVFPETQTQRIFHQAKEIQPNLIVIDSIQTLQTESIDSSPGSISQIRETASELIQYAKETQTPVILVGHITKEGQIAGPKILEHMVDVVLQFEGDRNHLFRLLRAQKNRFGSTAEMGIYQMKSGGLVEVKNPSHLLLSEKDETLSGNAIGASVEGIRPMLIEVQALVSTAVYGTPQRSATGIDTRRLNMLLAVLEKRAGFKLATQDVFLNITGGIRVDDPALDLAIICAILSSRANLPLPDNCCFAGEIGLSGEIRSVTRVEQRIQEAEKMGFDVIFVSKYNKVNPANFPIRVEKVGKVEDVLKLVF